MHGVTYYRTLLWASWNVWHWLPGLHSSNSCLKEKLLVNQYYNNNWKTNANRRLMCEQTPTQNLQYFRGAVQNRNPFCVFSYSGRRKTHWNNAHTLTMKTPLEPESWNEFVKHPKFRILRHKCHAWIALHNRGHAISFVGIAVWQKSPKRVQRWMASWKLSKITIHWSIGDAALHDEF